VTLGKSRVRKSRMLGSVRAKAKWLSYSTKAGVQCVPSKADQHAEENLLREVPDLKKVGTSKRAPCGPSEHDCARQLEEKGVEVEKKKK